MADVSKLISNRRKELGLTLEEVGEAVGVGKSTVQRWESGQIKTMGSDKIAKLASVLQIDPVELVPRGTDSTVLSRRYATDSMPKGIASPIIHMEDPKKDIASKTLNVNPSEIKVTQDQTKIYQALGVLAKVDKEAAMTLFQALVENDVL